MKKRAFSLLVTLTLCLILAPLSVFANSDETHTELIEPSFVMNAEEIEADNGANLFAGVDATWSLNSARHWVGETDAVVAAILRVSGTSIYNVVQVGVDIFDANSNRVASKRETPIPSGDYIDMWYYMNSELGYWLTPGAYYEAAFYCSIGSSVFGQTFVLEGGGHPSTPPSKTIIFDANGGITPTNSKTIYRGDTYGDLPTPTRSGYNFDGWYTDASGGTQITSDSTLNFSGNQTLYAHWTYIPVTYTVTFNPNGGVVEPGSKSVTEGRSYGELPTPYRSGYDFDGWFTDASGGVQITSGSTVNLSGNQTLYAHWSYVPASYTITFDANGGAVSPSSKTVTNGETYGELPTPTWNNRRFVGWFTAPANGALVSGDTTVNLTNNQTLYAHWASSNSYTVTFDANGGTGTPSPQTKEEDVPLTLSSLKPSKTYVLQYNANGGSVSPANKNVSCSFNHWNTEKNGRGTSYASGDSYATNADVTLYAQWTNPSAGALATPSRSNDDFVGWFTSVTGGVQITETSTVSENMTLYAHWTDPYNMGDETYSFENYVDSDSWGHCFGMSITSAGYHNNLLDIGRIGGNANTPLYSFSETQTVKQPICYYQSRQGSHSVHAIVAGGSFYLNRGYDIASDWQEVVNYVRTHDYDNAGALQIGFRKKDEGGHAINFLRYENVNGQERIYAYDNNFPNQETYFYQDSSGRVWQTPVQTFSGAIDCIALRDCGIYFNSVGDFDATHVLYMAKNAATVQGYAYSYMEGVFSGEEYVMYEIPANQAGVIIIPNRDYADFIYMGTEYSFGEITDETRGELKFASMDEGAMNADVNFRIFEDSSVTPTVSITRQGTILHYEIVNFDIDKMILFIADYDVSGRMLRVQEVSPLKQAGDISVTEAAKHQAFLLDCVTFAPLCAKASIS